MSPWYAKIKEYLEHCVKFRWTKVNPRLWAILVYQWAWLGTSLQPTSIDASKHPLNKIFYFTQATFSNYNQVEQSKNFQFLSQFVQLYKPIYVYDRINSVLRTRKKWSTSARVLAYSGHFRFWLHFRPKMPRIFHKMNSNPFNESIRALTDKPIGKRNKKKITAIKFLGHQLSKLAINRSKADNKLNISDNIGYVFSCYENQGAKITTAIHKAVQSKEK